MSVNLAPPLASRRASGQMGKRWASFVSLSLVSSARGVTAASASVTTLGHRRIVLPDLANNRAPQPGEINYNRLSPESREVLGQIALRLTAGWTSEEVAAEFNQHPPDFRHVPLLKNRATGYTSGWVNARLRTLRDEMVKSVDVDG